MTDYYIGEIRLVALAYAPVDFHDCDGTLLSIQGNEALYSLIGVTYGGDGVRTFALPDLRGRVPVSSGQRPGAQSYTIGGKGGTESVALTTSNMPPHTHTVSVSNQTATAKAPSATVAPGNVGSDFFYMTESQAGTVQALFTDTITPSGGGSAPHENRQQSIALRYIIALRGLYPQPN